MQGDDTKFADFITKFNHIIQMKSPVLSKCENRW